jgi:hypothetical protein
MVVSNGGCRSKRGVDQQTMPTCAGYEQCYGGHTNNITARIAVSLRAWGTKGCVECPHQLVTSTVVLARVPKQLHDSVVTSAG